MSSVVALAKVLGNSWEQTLPTITDRTRTSRSYPLKVAFSEQRRLTIPGCNGLVNRSGLVLVRNQMVRLFETVADL
jgi:hypothetical protein